MNWKSRFVAGTLFQLGIQRINHTLQRDITVAEGVSARERESEWQSQKRSCGSTHGQHCDLYICWLSRRIFSINWMRWCVQNKVSFAFVFVVDSHVFLFIEIVCDRINSIRHFPRAFVSNDNITDRFIRGRKKKNNDILCSSYDLCHSHIQAIGMVSMTSSLTRNGRHKWVGNFIE